MGERLAFTFGGVRRELRDRVDWVRRPEKGTLPEATAAYLPPVERPNWGFWGVFFAIPLATLVKAVLDAWPQHPEPQVSPLM